MKHLKKTALKYEQLNDKAKKNAIEELRNWHYNDLEFYNDLLQDDFNYIIEETFPTSDVKYTYSLSSRQGDGFGIYGSLSFKDVESLTGETFSELEKDLIKVGSDFDGNCDIKIYNDRGLTFFNDSMIEISYENDINYFMYYDPYFEGTQEDIDKAIKHIKVIELKLQDKLSKLCKEWEDIGYDYLYPSDETLVNDYIDEVYDNGYEFDEDGNIVNADYYYDNAEYDEGLE